MLRAGAGLGDDALILPVEPALGSALAEGAFSSRPGDRAELRVIEVIGSCFEDNLTFSKM